MAVGSDYWFELSTIIDKIAIDGHVYSDPTGVANQFNNYFCSIADDIAAELPATTGMPVSYSRQINNSFFFTKRELNLKRRLNLLPLAEMAEAEQWMPEDALESGPVYFYSCGRVSEGFHVSL